MNALNSQAKPSQTDKKTQNKLREEQFWPAQQALIDAGFNASDGTIKEKWKKLRKIYKSLFISKGKGKLCRSGIDKQMLFASAAINEDQIKMPEFQEFVKIACNEAVHNLLGKILESPNADDADYRKNLKDTLEPYATFAQRLSERKSEEYSDWNTRIQTLMGQLVEPNYNLSEGCDLTRFQEPDVTSDIADSLREKILEGLRKPKSNSMQPNGGGGSAQDTPPAKDTRPAQDTPPTQGNDPANSTNPNGLAAKYKQSRASKKADEVTSLIDQIRAELGGGGAKK